MEGVERFDMPSGHTVYYRDSDHQYNELPEMKKSTRLAGISTIAKNDGQPGADGLMDWAARLTCEGVAREAAISLDVFLEDAGEVDAMHWLTNGARVQDMLKRTKATWRDIRDEAGARGTVSHNVLQSLAEGVTPAFESGHDFAVISWWKTRRPEPIHVEQVVYDHERKFAGRFDLMYRPDSPILLDLKTGSVRNSAMVQMNLYALACRAAGLTVPERLLVLDTRDDGSWHEIQIPIKAHWALTALDAHRNGADMRRCLTQAKRDAASGRAQQELAEAA